MPSCTFKCIRPALIEFKQGFVLDCEDDGELDSPVAKHNILDKSCTFVSKHETWHGESYMYTGHFQSGNRLLSHLGVVVPLNL